MNPTLRDQFERLGLRLAELDANLSDPQVLADINRYRSLSREQAEVAQVVQQFRQYQQRERDLAAGREMLADPEMAELAGEEIAAAQADLERLHARAAGRPAAARPGRRAQRLPGNPRRHRRRRIGAVCRRPGAHVPALLRAPRLAHRGDEREPVRTGRLQGTGAAHRGRPGLRSAALRIRRPPRAARAGHRIAGAHPHQRLHRGGDARGRRGRAR